MYLSDFYIPVNAPFGGCGAATQMFAPGGKYPRAATAGSLGQLSLPSLRGRKIEYRLILLAWVNARRVHLCRVAAGVISSGNAWERRSQSYFDSGNGVPRNEIVR